MYILDLYDLLFFIKALKQPQDHFNIHHHVSFSTNSTRSASTNKLNHIHTNNNYSRNFYVFQQVTKNMEQTTFY